MVQQERADPNEWSNKGTAPQGQEVASSGPLTFAVIQVTYSGIMHLSSCL